MLRWGADKARQSGHGKNIKIVAFGHENYMLKALDKHFDEQSVGNCETISFEVDEQGIKGSYRGNDAGLDWYCI